MNSLRTLDDAALQAWPLPPLCDTADKESRGRVVIVAGGRETPGAAILAAQAALRAGAGKVLIGTGASVAMHIAVAVPELRVIGLPETASGGLEPAAVARLDKAIAGSAIVLIGPGMQDEEATIAFSTALRERCPKVPMMLDAAAMAAASRKRLQGDPVLITPHAGEMAHLSGHSKASVLDDPRGAACAAALNWNAIVALKGATTVIARPEGGGWLHEGGNAGLATAGSGDVLAGLIAGFVARGASLELAAAWGVVTHSRVGVRLAERMGGPGYLAGELSAEVPAVLAEQRAV